ncbi:hypothetical protein [Streptomyces ficellus]|uniref:Uncharacterized protein n=1 Tax=Streptomyces ficellus TaxID=1977088 RepID=A0A6I6F4H6_9ACTN|nr:hypothetical protein [Streptomyces ficellus]QGV78923.1 hypothetical protein EIZ62_12195 [Streptomyces ficellus]
MRRDRKRLRDGDAADRDTAVRAALLAALVPGGEADPAGEERAVAAFRAARDEGRHAGARGLGRQGDWRPGRERRRRRSLRAGAMGLAATVLLGGVAVAAQSGAIRSPFGGGGGGAAPEPRPSVTSTPPDVTGAPDATRAPGGEPQGPGPSRQHPTTTPSDRPGDHKDGDDERAKGRETNGKKNHGRDQDQDRGGSHNDKGWAHRHDKDRDTGRDREKAKDHSREKDPDRDRGTGQQKGRVGPGQDREHDRGRGR